MLDRHFRDRLRDYRKRQGLRTSQVGDKCQIQAHAVRRWERGETKPTLDHISTLCRLYRCTADALLFGSHDEKHVYAIDVEPGQRISIELQALPESGPAVAYKPPAKIGKIASAKQSEASQVSLKKQSRGQKAEARDEGSNEVGVSSHPTKASKQGRVAEGKIYTTEEAVSYLFGRPPETLSEIDQHKWMKTKISLVQRWFRSEEIPAKRVGRNLYYSKAGLDRFLKSLG